MTARTIARSIMIGVFAMAPPAAMATPPLSSAPTEVWLRVSRTETLYVAEEDDRLSALCIQVGDAQSWLPKELLSDIALPDLVEVNIIRGMGFARIDEFVPDWGSWGLSVAVRTLSVADGAAGEGPAYFFVLHEGRVVHRVERRWLPDPVRPGRRVLDEQWTPVSQAAIRSAPCRPPSDA